MRHALVLSVLAVLALAPPVAHAGMLPDLAITKTASVETARVGEEITFTLVVTNNGAVAAIGVVMTDRIPAALDRVSVMTDTGTCMDGEPITCMVGDLAVGATATITIVTRANAEGRITNMAGVVGTTADASPADNQNSDFVDVTGAVPDGGVAPDGAVPADGGMMMMMTEEEDGCGCVIPAGGPRVPGPAALLVGLLGACVIARRGVSRLRGRGHFDHRWRSTK